MQQFVILEVGRARTPQVAYITYMVTANTPTQPVRSPLARALCGAGFGPNATRAQVQQAYDIAVWDCAWNHAACIKRALDLFSQPAK
jgi:hypothetical protein